MKILFILDLYKPHIWGVEILFENIISRLEEKWNKITILTTKFDKNLSSYEKISKNIEIYRVWHNRYDFMFYSIFKWIKLAKESDIIHTTTYNSAIPASIISKITWKKVVLTVHEIFWKLWYKFVWYKWFFFKLFESFIFKFNFDKYICVSNYTKNSLRISFWIEDKKLVTVYNWIDYKKWNKNNYKIEDIEFIKKENNLMFHYTGLFFWRPWISKWLENYIKSIPLIIKEINNFKAILIVPETDKVRVNYIKWLINDLNISKNIIWIPWVANEKLANYIFASDFVIVPSLAEGFWFAAAEVCSLDHNLLVSNISSLSEVVSWKINFIEPWNINDIKKWVINFYNWNYTTIQKKEFLWEDNIEKTLDIYNELLWK